VFYDIGYQPQLLKVAVPKRVDKIRTELLPAPDVVKFRDKVFEVLPASNRRLKPGSQLLVYMPVELFFRTSETVR